MLNDQKTAPVKALIRATCLPLFAALCLGGAVAAATPQVVPPAVNSSPALNLGALSTLQDILPTLAEKRVVLVGEQHTRYDHHLVQLEIIRGLHQHHPQLAIGLEMFQQPFQGYLDDYVAGTIDEVAMLRATEYHTRWQMDYRMYAPILRYAREHQLPLIALNVPVERSREVGKRGLGGLTPEERAELPADIAPADAAYEQRMREVFDHHPNDNGQDFAHFLDVQLLWDESMAERAAAFLQAHPDHHLVILAGNAHLAYGSAIPDRLTRRIAASRSVILNSWDGPIEPGLADFLLFPAERALPAAGRIGALLEQVQDGVLIQSCTATSACADAGLRGGDRILSIDETPIGSIADLRIAMWDKQPGDPIRLGIKRKRWLASEKTISFDITLK